MKELTTILTEIDTLIDAYHTMKLTLVKDQSEILRGLTTNLYFLEAHRIDAFETWQYRFHDSKAGSAAAKQRDADYKVPELYRIRRIMEGGYLVVDSIRSTISIYKKES